MLASVARVSSNSALWHIHWLMQPCTKHPYSVPIQVAPGNTGYLEMYCYGKGCSLRAVAQNPGMDLGAISCCSPCQMERNWSMSPHSLTCR